MRLVKVATHKNESLIGLWQDGNVLPLSLGDRQFRSLTDILEADDPVAAVELLIDYSMTRRVSGAWPGRSTT